MSTIENVWVAQSHEPEAVAVEVFTDRDAAEAWAVENIGRDNWAKYVAAMASSGESAPDIDTATRAEILTAWYGPAKDLANDGIEYGNGYETYLIIEQKTVR